MLPKNLLISQNKETDFYEIWEVDEYGNKVELIAENIPGAVIHSTLWRILETTKPFILPGYKYAAG